MATKFIFIFLIIHIWITDALESNDARNHKNLFSSINKKGQDSATALSSFLHKEFSKTENVLNHWENKTHEIVKDSLDSIGKPIENIIENAKKEIAAASDDNMTCVKKSEHFFHNIRNFATDIQMKCIIAKARSVLEDIRDIKGLIYEAFTEVDVIPIAVFRCMEGSDNKFECIQNQIKFVNENGQKKVGKIQQEVFHLIDSVKSLPSLLVTCTESLVTQTNEQVRNLFQTCMPNFKLELPKFN